MGRRSRKRGRTEPAPAPAARARSRSETRNAEARDRLEPLGEGERPAAVTVGAAVVTLLAVVNLVGYLAGVDVRGDRPSAPGVLAFELVFLAMAVGMWRVRYWAVLGFQALLALMIIVFTGLLIVASNLLAVAVCIPVIALGGVLFWFMVKAMARIQMPERR